jgi:hypothetical protein
MILAALESRKPWDPGMRESGGRGLSLLYRRTFEKENAK